MLIDPKVPKNKEIHAKNLHNKNMNSFKNSDTSPLNPQVLTWLYLCHRSPETGELFARVIDWELAFYLADADAQGRNPTPADIAARFDQTTQTARNRLKKLREGGLIESDARVTVTAEFRALMDRYLTAMVANLETSGLFAAGTASPAQLLPAMIAANDLQRSGDTLMTGMPWIIMIELAHAAENDQFVDITQLAAACRCSLNTISGVLNSLMDRSVLARMPDPRDKRKQRWVLAERGWGEVASYCQKMAGYLGVG